MQGIEHFHILYSVGSLYNSFLCVLSENGIDKNFSMVVFEEVMDCCFGVSWQPLRLTWNIITYRFARSIVTNVYKIFEYIYNFSIHVSSDVQTDCLFTSLGSHPLGNNYNNEDSLNIIITCAWATRGGHAGRLKYCITHDAQS